MEPKWIKWICIRCGYEEKASPHVLRVRCKKCGGLMIREVNQRRRVRNLP